MKFTPFEIFSQICHIATLFDVPGMLYSVTEHQFEGGHVMQHDQIIKQIIERLQACADESLLDLILKIVIESGY